MASPTSTFATLRALQLVITDALDDIQRVFSQNSSPDLSSSPPSQCSSPVYACSPDLDPSPATSPFPATPPTSFPPTPLSATFPSTLRSHPHTDASVPFVDYPSPDVPLIPNSPSEQLALHPVAVAAASRIVAACGQMSNIVHKPFSSLCDAIMSYNLPACMRLVEHLHVVEILREAEEDRQHSLSSGKASEMLQLSSAKRDTNLEASGPTSNASTRDTAADSRVHKLQAGLHVTEITNIICSYAGINYIDPNDLVHALRLLSTHHIFRETAPDTFALTRVASLLDSGKSVKAVFSNPETKYDDTGEIPAFVALTTDESFKSAAYLTEAFTGGQLPTQTSTSYPSSSAYTILPGTTMTSSTSGFVVNDPVPCPSTTRSSSVLTHIVYPEISPLLSSLLATEPPANHALCSPPEDGPPNFQPFATDSTASLPSDVRLVEASTQTEAEHFRSGHAVKPEKLPAFNLAFHTNAPFFEWLENGGKDPLGGTGKAACVRTLTRTSSIGRDGVQLEVPYNAPNCVPQTSFRLDRFSKAMTGTTMWEAPRAILSGFDWYSLPRGSTIVDVGGGIGSTTMILARTLNDPRIDLVKERDGAHRGGTQPTPPAVPHHNSAISSDSSFMARDDLQDDSAPMNALNLRFVVQDRPVVTALGIEAWRSKCPELLESGQVTFQDHDFFEPQLPFEPPHLTRHPAVYILRVVLHDWPDEWARRILINLRVASNPETRLLIAEHVLPLACLDEGVMVDLEACDRGSSEQWTLSSVLANVEGAESALVPPPLLSNLGKASANVYWMDLLMHIMFNAKERTLREFCALALSAGWRVTRMTRPEGTLFAYLVCEPIGMPDDAQAIHNAVVLSSELSTVVAIPYDEPVHNPRAEPARHKQLPARPVSLLPSPIFDRPPSRCGTPTFGSRMLLPRDEELRTPKTRGSGMGKKWLKSKGLGVRSVMMQKAEKQREEQYMAKGDLPRDTDDVQNAVRTSPSQMRVWWKKSSPGSTANSSIAIHELGGEAPEHRTIGRGWRGTLKPSNSPSTSSPRVLPVHQKWSSSESAALPTSEASSPASRVRRPSVASITRKLSFATFGRRPSAADTTEPLPTPPHSATMTELAPSPSLRSDTPKRSLKHLPSLPTLGRAIAVTDAVVERPAIPRRPSLGFAGQRPPPPSALKSALPRRVEIAESAKRSIIMSRTSPYTSTQGSFDAGGPAAPASIAGRQRRMTLSNSMGTQLQRPSGGTVPSDLVGPEMKRIPSMPKLPRRLSIPMLRRKQSQSVIQDRGNEG